MACLDEIFRDFHERVSLPKTRTDRIQAAYGRLREFSASHAGLKSVLAEAPFLQGSYAQATALNPPDNRAEFDVDVVLVLTKEFARDRCDWDGEAVISQLVNQFSQDADYKSRILRRPRCIRLRYAGEFHLDVVPTVIKESSGTLLLPTARGAEWDETDPKGFLSWIQERNELLDGRFTRAMKFLKEWRHFQFEKDYRIPSVALAAYAGRHIPTPEKKLRQRHAPLYYQRHKCDATVLTDMFIIMDDCMKEKSGNLRVPNPTLPDEDLARDWSEDAFVAFREAITRAARLAERAVREEERGKSADLWSKLLGPRFPSS